MEELSACPFCEEDHVSVDGESGNHTGGESHWTVCCSFCGACGPEVKTRAQAVSTWNELAALREQAAEMTADAEIGRLVREMLAGNKHGPSVNVYYSHIHGTYHVRYSHWRMTPWSSWAYTLLDALRKAKEG